MPPVVSEAAPEAVASPPPVAGLGTDARPRDAGSALRSRFAFKVRFA